MALASTDDVAAQFDFNFKPGDQVTVFRARGIVVAVDAERHMCKVMWTTNTGRIMFRTQPNYELVRMRG